MSAGRSFHTFTTDNDDDGTDDLDGTVKRTVNTKAMYNVCCSEVPEQLLFTILLIPILQFVKWTVFDELYQKESFHF